MRPCFRHKKFRNSNIISFYLPVKAFLNLCKVSNGGALYRI